MKKLVFVCIIFSFHSVFSQWELTGWKSDPSIYFVASEGSSVFLGNSRDFHTVSTDYGINWLKCDDGINKGEGFQTVYIHDSIIYMGTYGNLFISENLGRTWALRNSGIPGFFVISSFLGLEDKVYAGTWNHGILMSTDKGYTWIPKNNGIPLSIVNCFATIGTNIFASIGFENKIYLSTDYGASWTLKNKGLDSFSVFNQLAVIDSNIFVTSFNYSDARGGNKKIYLSTDFGDNWIEKNNSVIRKSGPYLITSIDGRLFIGSYDSLHYSDDFGDTWFAMSLIKDYYRGAEYLSASKDMIYAASGTELFKSSDNGDTWISLRNYLNYGPVNSLTSYQNNLYACSDRIKNNTTFNDGLYYSKDNGDTWIRKGLEGLFVYSVLFKEDMIFAGTNNGFFRSDDGGLSWINKGNEVLKGKLVYQLVFIGENIIIPHSGGYFKSTDLGESWTLINNILPKDQFNNVVLVNNDYIIAGLSRSIYFSSDKGETWENRSNGLPETDLDIKAVEVIDDTIFLGTVYGIFVSPDKGLSWQVRNKGLPIDFNKMIEVTKLVKYKKLIFVGIRYSGVFYSSDNGLNWINTNCNYFGDFQISALTVHNEYIYVGTNIGGFGSDGDAIYRAKLSDFGITDVKEEDNTKTQQITIYPLPSSDFINISNNGYDGKVEIFDVLGNKVMDTKYNGKINISSLPIGVYFIHTGSQRTMFIKGN